MEKVRLGDIASFSKGKQINVSNLISNGKYDFLNGGINPSGKWNDFNVNENSIAISEGGNSCGYVNFMKNKFWCGAHCYYLYDVKLNIKYLYYNLKANEKKIQKLRSGACMPNIKKKDLYDFEIWYLSDKSEQEKIVKQLDKVQEIIDLRKKQIEELDNLIKVQFVDMFEDENNWNEVTLNDIAIKITDGEHGTVPRVDNGKLYLMARNITTSNTIDLSEVSYIPEENHRKIYKRCNPEKNDLLLVCVGATVGKVALVPEMEEFSIARSVALIKPNKKVISSLYLLSLMNSDYMQSQIKNCVHAAAQAGLYTNMIKELKFKLPPIELQNKFAVFVNQINKQKFILGKSLKETEDLQESLMNKYFN